MILGTQASELGSGSKAQVFGSVISGLGSGIELSPRSELWLDNSIVTGLAKPQGGGYGIRLAGGVVNAFAGSEIVGEENGLVIADGSISTSDGTFKLVNAADINESLIEAHAGAAIRVESPRGSDYFNVAEIDLRNGSRLLSGVGLLLEVESGAKVKFGVHNASLVGDLFAHEGSVLDIALDHGASLVGGITNGNSLTVNSEATWSLGANNTLGALTLHDGRIMFAKDGFHTLSIGTLSGIGTFDMRINLDNAQGDLLNVTGQATGHHQLNVQNTGVEAVKPEFEPLRIVHTEGGDAQFGLIGGRVDLGAYSYLLEKQDNDWFIVGEGKVISPSTQSALALFNAAPAIWNSELTTLRSRMGEVRGQEEGGGWIRSYGNRFNAGTGAGMHYQQKQQGLSFGADAPIPVSNGSLVIGVMGGYSKSDLDLSRGTSGEVNSYYAGVYGTWLLDDGYYLDGVLKLNKFRNESEVAMSDGTKAKGRYNNTALGGSVEFGRHIKLSDDYFVEPYTQLSSVFIGGDSYTLSNGLKAKNDRTQSVLGKVGTTAGRDFTLKDGSVLQPYVRVALAHEFAHDNEVKVNETRFDNSLSGSRLELGAGVAVSLSKRVQLHADFDYMKGEHVEQPWGANVGLKLAF
jgi:outer membrane autotransporter protein